MKNQDDYSKYKCPYHHIKKDCGHELHGPEGYENTYGIWCPCGFRGPVFCLDPEELGFVKIDSIESEESAVEHGQVCAHYETNCGFDKKSCGSLELCAFYTPAS